MSRPIPTCWTCWRHSSSFVFNVLVDEVFVKFFIMFGWILDMMAESYVVVDVKAWFFGAVRLDHGCHESYYVDGTVKAQVFGAVRPVVRILFG